jgi:protein TonB
MCNLKLSAFASMIAIAGAAAGAFGLALPAGAATTQPEENYIRALHDRLGHAMVYPASREMRELRPQGTTQLWLDVDRVGNVRASGVDVSSGQRLLDRGAVRDVRRSRLPSMPPDAFIGEATHRFVVRVDYMPAFPTR